MSLKQPSPQAQDFYQELLKVAFRIGQKHGIDVPQFNMIERNGVLVVNMAGYIGKADDFWKNTYKYQAKSLGLEQGWIGCEFIEPETNQRLKVIGLDIDGGENCIRVRDENNLDYHISPATLIDRITNNVVI